MIVGTQKATLQCVSIKYSRTRRRPAPKNSLSFESRIESGATFKIRMLGIKARVGARPVNSVATQVSLARGHIVTSRPTLSVAAQVAFGDDQEQLCHTGCLRYFSDKVVISFSDAK